MQNAEGRTQKGVYVSRVCSALAICVCCVSQLTAQDDEGARFFESKIRPILVKHCYECHGSDLQENKLRVDSLEALNRGGKAGSFIVAGKPEKSLLIAAIGYQVPDLQMPPDKKLGEREIADLTAWVKMGAPHPDRQPGGPAVVEKFDLAEGKKFWSFQPVVDHPSPAVKDTAWAKNAIDPFILQPLEAKGLKPAPPADKLTLLRRATFDLTGLPPTPAEIAAFLQDDSPTAFAAVIDRLLESPHYGERWGRHWLDVARYADSNGLDENIAHGNAWRYRDYVIRSLNADKPYDQFLLEQLAGDLLPADNTAVRQERLIATGFLALGPKVLAEVDETKMEMDILDEQVDTVGRALLGLTFGCARCHDHKFDPIRAEDYYALAGIFKSTRTMEHFKKIARWWENPLASPAEVQRKAALDKLVAEQKAALDALLKKSKDELQAKLKPGEQLPKEFEGQLTAEVQTELKVRREELARLTASAPAIPTAMGVSEGQITDVPVHIRGSHLALGEVVPRGFPIVLASTDQPKLPADRSGRLELAQWLTRKDHPLTSRVMVNRIWRWHFGQGLVSTPDNFGKLGDRPSHPELLDWLALRFMEGGWSVKQMHRLLMLSQAYQMSSAHDAKGSAADPENRLYWRMPLRRLEAEEIRDALLASSGLLDRAPATSLLHVNNREFLFDHTSKDGTKYDSLKRSIYLPVIRNNLYDVFQLFDATDATVLDGNRATTVVAPQALFMLNSDLVLAASKNLAENVIAETASPSARIESLYLRTFGRSPTPREVERAMAYVEKLGASGKDEAEAWASFGHVLMSANEFIYLR